MTAKNKIIVSLASICGVLVIALVAVVSVWAASSAYVYGNVYISYTAQNVTCNVSAYYQQASTSITSTSTQTQIGSTVKLTYTNTSGTVSASSLTLSSSSPHMYIWFTFANQSSTEKISVTCTMTLSVNTSMAGSANYNSASAGCYAIYWGTSKTSLSTIANGSAITTQTVSASGTSTIYYRLTLTNFADSSQVKAYFVWTLTPA